MHKEDGQVSQVSTQMVRSLKMIKPDSSLDNNNYRSVSLPVTV